MNNGNFQYEGFSLRVFLFKHFFKELFFFNPFWNCFKNLLHSLFVVWCFLSSTVHSFKRATFFLLFIGILTQQRNMHLEIMPPACYENHISFFLYTGKKREKQKGEGVMVCKGCLRPPLRIPSLAPSSFISFLPLLFTTSKRPLLSLSCWPTFGLNRNFWKWSFHPYRIGTV